MPLYRNNTHTHNRRCENWYASDSSDLELIDYAKDYFDIHESDTDEYFKRNDMNNPKYYCKELRMKDYVANLKKQCDNRKRIMGNQNSKNIKMSTELTSIKK